MLLWACGAVTDLEEMPELPREDAETWDARIEIGRPGQRIEIRASYLREFAEVQQVHAEGGVEVAFRQDEVIVSSMKAERLVLEHKRDRFGLAGGVVVQAGDSLVVEADTLVWEGADERLRIPGRLKVEFGQGWERGRNLISNMAVDEWTMESVEGHWHGRSGNNLVVRAERETSRRIEGQQLVVYDSVTVEYDEVRLTGSRATFKPEVNLFSFAGGVIGADSSFQFSAERADVDVEGERLLARGTVRYSGEGAELRAEVVEEDRRSSLLQAQGTPATYLQRARRIEARALDYQRHERVLTARGGVVFREDELELTAIGLRYARDGGQISAWREVVLQAPELQGDLTGDSLFFDLQQQVGLIRGEPLLRRVGKGGEELTFAAAILRFDLARSEIECEEDFILRAEGVEVNAGRGVVQADSARVLVVDGVELDQLDAERGYRSLLRADSMIVELADQQVERIAIPGRIYGQVEAEGRDQWIEGRGARVFMVAGDLNRVEVDAEADVTHRYRQKDEVSRFSGREMTLYFDAGGLRRALVTGQAELVTRLQDEWGEAAVNEVGGDQLEIHFADGSISEVRIGPDIEGSYYPPEKEP